MDWPPDKDVWPEGFSAHRDGWVKWYKGSSRHVCGKRTPIDKIPEIWFQVVKPRIDRELPIVIHASTEKTYREVLSEFLDACEHRVKTGKPRPMSERTLWNYIDQLNDFGLFVGASRPFRETNRAEIFTSYGKRFGDWKTSGFDSVVSRVGALYRWAAKMDYIDRWRPGPEFQRPAKGEIRSERIELTKSYTPAEIAKILTKASPVVQMWCWLGILCGFIQSDIANLRRRHLDVAERMIDYRRRKKGKIRRLCPLPDALFKQLHALLVDDGDEDRLVFVTKAGDAFNRIGPEGPIDSISRLWRKACVAAGVTNYKFTGLRTANFNLMPLGYDTESKIIRGRAKGTIDEDHYREAVDLARLRFCVEHIYALINSALHDEALRSATPTQSEHTEETPEPGGAG